MANNNNNSMAIINVYDAYSTMADAINDVEAAMQPVVADAGRSPFSHLTKG